MASMRTRLNFVRLFRDSRTSKAYIGGAFEQCGFEALRDIQADAIYFLMWGGWKQELRSNPWHFAKQWSRHLPVILLQPEVDARKPVRSDVADGVANCRLLYIRAGGGGVETWSDADQIEQIYADIRSRGFRRANLWLYNSHMVEAFASSPAVARVVHATETYFDWASMDRTFLNRLALRSEDTCLMAWANMPVMMMSLCSMRTE